MENHKYSLNDKVLIARHWHLDTEIEATILGIYTGFNDLIRYLIWTKRDDLYSLKDTTDDMANVISVDLSSYDRNRKASAWVDDKDIIVCRKGFSINNDGVICKRCGDKNPWAEPNQDDGTFLCYKCRNNF